MSPFHGLSAFPLTPMDERGMDQVAFVALLQRLAKAGVDSIGALGSTGCYAYLNRAERLRVAQLTVQHADGIPVMIGIGALRTREVLQLAEDAQKAGASALLLAPVSYQPLTEDEVFELYRSVSQAISVPLCVYDNPRTTHFEFSDALHGRIAQLPHIGSIKIPGVPADPAAARARVDRLRAQVPAHVTIGVSGDASGAAGLNAGCDAWYSVVAGLFPARALEITQAARGGDAAAAVQQSDRLAPLWALFSEFGSLRVIATAAELCGLGKAPCLPLPLRSLEGKARQRLQAVIDALALD